MRNVIAVANIGCVNRTQIAKLLPGFDTSNNMLSNGIHALLRHPEEFALLKADPSLSRAVTNEVLRYDTPGFDTFYYMVGDHEVAGLELAPGTPVMLFLGIANHDPRAYESPADSPAPSAAQEPRHQRRQPRLKRPHGRATACPGTPANNRASWR